MNYGLVLTLCLILVACATGREFKTDRPNQYAFKLENGLEVMIISDSRFPQSSAALSVPVGSSSDPMDHQGLAHYLEHLLFLGSGKYPNVGEYQETIRKSGGYSNAFTREHETNYQFEVATPIFAETLDRFSRFFIDPHFDPVFFEKELHAVQSEHDKNLQFDGWRLNHLLGQLSPPGHPLHRFRIGNHETLKNTSPEQVRQFYERHYSSNLMKLVVMGPQSRGELERMVRKSFSAVPNRNLKSPDYTTPLKFVQTGQFISMKTVGSTIELKLLFPVSDWREHVLSKPFTVISNLLGRQGEDSLDSILKEKGLISSMSLSGTMFHSEAFLDASFTLTQKGAKETLQIVNEFFAAVRAVKKDFRESRVYSDSAEIMEIGHRYAGLREGAQVAASYAAEMHFYPATEIDRIRDLIAEQKPDVLESYLEQLKPSNMTVYFLGPQVKTRLKEHYFGILYEVIPLSKSPLAGVHRHLKVSSGVKSPAPNLFIPRDFKIHQSNKTEKPYLLSDDRNGKVWFFQESREFLQPKAFVRLEMLDPTLSTSVREALISNLYFNLISKYVYAWGQPIFSAYSSFRISWFQDGVAIDVGSFSDQTVKILKEVVSRLRTTEFTEQDFKIEKERAVNFFHARKVDGAYEQTRNQLDELLVSNFSMDEKEKALRHITFADLRKFRERALRRFQINALFYGNLDPQEIAPLARSIHSLLKAEPLNPKESDVIKSQTRRMPLGKQLVLNIKSTNNNNAFTRAYYTGPRTVKASILMQALDLLIASAYYSQLRTEQQLGYLVLTDRSILRTETSLNFSIQSGSHSAERILRNSDEFLRSHLTSLKSRIPGELAHVKRMLKESIGKDEIDMGAAYSDFLNWIFERGGNVNYKEDLLEEIEKLSAEDLVSYIDTYFLSPTRTTLTTVHTKPGSQTLRLNPDESQITDLKEFIRLTSAKPPPKKSESAGQKNQ